MPNPALEVIATRLEALYRVPLAGPGLNYYRDGHDSVAFHADRELKHLDDTLVAILTLGASRPFLLRPHGGGRSVDLRPSSGDLLVMVNGMGGTPLIELYVVYAEVAKIAAAHGLTIERNLIGNYITSLEMQGCSITLLKLDDEMLHYWDAPVNTPGMRWGV